MTSPAPPDAPKNDQHELGLGWGVQLLDRFVADNEKAE